ncbi:MAG: hypothetical protein GX677_11070, partial [Treponema sp.]|nr:hypothetical protein [Treponema sp.]
MKRKFIECCFLCFIISFSYSENDIYFDADQNTKILITNTDQLIKDRRYESAFNNLGKIDTNEYIIAKKVEICLNYFVQSIKHQMFAFKDLQNNEDIYKLRGEKGTYNIIVYDPVKVIQTFDKNESSAILNKALGDYYYEINLRYKGRWIISDEEV